jgi:aspartyl-tRNA(Asn)/glutamyl-tRNA(Gln) amidotransferase subunit A
MSAAELASAVRRGELSAESLVERSLSAIEERESELHAFNLVLNESARARAAEIDTRVRRGEHLGPLAGVPVAVKDNICTRDIETTCSSRILAGWRPPYEATAVERLLAADAVIVGKTNMDEFGMGSTTENSALGPTCNPHNTALAPGGSSGGSAAAVGAGCVTLALGSDTGGSVRQPAALCGVVGVKPTYGLVSRCGLVAYASSLDQIGVIASSVEDAALALGLIVGHDERDATSLSAVVPSDFVVQLESSVQGLRVGVVEEMLAGCDPAVVATVRDAAAALESEGAEVREVSLPVLDHAIPAYYLIALAEASSNLSRYDGVRYGLRIGAPTASAMNSATRTAGFGPEVKRRIMLGTYALSAGYYDEWYGKAQRVRTVIARQLSGVYAELDVLLAPIIPNVALELGELEDPLTAYLSDRCTVVANLAGYPSISVPFGVSEDRPIGVQLMCDALGESTLLRTAAALEAQAAWKPSPLRGAC